MIMVEYDRNSPHRSGHYQPTPRENHQYPHLEQAQAQAPSTPSPPYHYAHLSQYPSQQQQQQVTTSRSTPTSYPSPVSYPSPSMSAYSYQQMPQQGHNSPLFQPMNVPPYSLPPIRMTPPTAQAIPQQFGPPLSHMYSPHTSHPPPHGIPTSSVQHHPSSAPLRFPLPQVTPERIMSGGRHKKEIKRRTKTGCLTCRKRRIKCDEAHPTCKNCAKSKRECMGYDPIFKSQPGPAAIQPAPSSGPVPNPASIPQISHPYGPMGMLGYGAPMSTATTSTESSCEPCEFPAIDPSLEAAPVPTYSSGMVMLADTSTAYRQDLKRAFDRVSPFSDTPRPTGTPARRSHSPNPSTTRDSSGSNPAKRIKIDDLLTGGASALPLTPPSVDQPQQDKLLQTNTQHYYQQPRLQQRLEGAVPQQMLPLLDYTISIYRMGVAPRLDAFFETGWFQTRGVERVIRGGQFTENLGNLLRRVYDRGGTFLIEEDKSLVNYTGDAEVIMSAVKLLYGTIPPHGAKQQSDEEADYAEPSDILSRNETLNRIKTVEALLNERDGTKIQLSSPHFATPGYPNYETEHSSSYWNALAQVVQMDSMEESERTFERVFIELKRNLKDFWSRDVLYQIAIARHLTIRLKFQPHSPSEHAWRRIKDTCDQARSVVHGAARTTSEASNPNEPSITRRIAGRAVGIWGRAILDCALVL
ncbi:hypothetical protein DFH27DRAFT_522152 [Peziza echinospora]|nr:hypothetical protein DFH27DRAFT_522152 [Peziza echinospora]